MADHEDLDAFRSRARAWLAEAMPPLEEGADPYEAMAEQDAAAYARGLQRTLAEGGFAGLVFPREYGGHGLTAEHQRVFTQESATYQSPLRFNMSTVAIVAPTLLEFGTEAQKQVHLPAILRGEEMWAQFLSEPTGGSDLAGAVTTATRDGDVFVLRGSKIWSSGAHLRDHAMCLVRTNWDAPKHRGLTMLAIEIDQPGIEVVRIRQVDGSAEFCQEFFDDVAVPADAVVGAVDDGWAVASRMLFHERNAIGGGTPYAGRITGRRRGSGGTRRQRHLVELARDTGQADDDRVRDLVAEAHVLTTVRGQLIGRIGAGARAGKLPGATTSLLKLFTATSSVRIASIALEVAGTDAVAAPGPDGPVDRYGTAFLARQTICLGGGTNEMQRNAISERVLGMPREASADVDLPFADVRRNQAPRPERA